MAPSVARRRHDINAHTNRQSAAVREAPITANNDTYIASVKSASVTKTLAIAAATSAEQSTLDASRSVVGYREGFPTGNATYVAACQAATTALQVARAQAEMAKQSAIMVAADLIRAQGEKPT